MKTYRLKVWAGPFESILKGRRRHIVYPSAAGIEQCDRLLLDEFDEQQGQFTDTRIEVQVTDMTAGGTAGLPVDICVLSIAPLCVTSTELPFSPAADEPISGHVEA